MQSSRSPVDRHDSECIEDYFIQQLEIFNIIDFLQFNVTIHIIDIKCNMTTKS